MIPYTNCTTHHSSEVAVRSLQLLTQISVIMPCLWHVEMIFLWHWSHYAGMRRLKKSLKHVRNNLLLQLVKTCCNLLGVSWNSWVADSQAMQNYSICLIMSAMSGVALWQISSLSPSCCCWERKDMLRHRFQPRCTSSRADEWYKMIQIIQLLTKLEYNSYSNITTDLADLSWS